MHLPGLFNRTRFIKGGRWWNDTSGQISEMPISLQSVLRSFRKNSDAASVAVVKSVNVRIVATTNRNLIIWGKAGNFREIYFIV